MKKLTKKQKIGIGVGTILGASLISNLIVFNSPNSNQNVPPSTTLATTITTSQLTSETVTQALIDESDKIALLKDTMKKAYGDNSNLIVDDDSRVVIIQTWEPNLATGLMLAKQGDKTSLNNWKQMVSSYVDLSKQTQDYLQTYTIHYVVLNDANKDLILLSVVNGVVTYNALYDINV